MQHSPLIIVLQNLDRFLEENKKDMFTFIENSRRPFNLGYNGNFFKLFQHLVTGFPICHCNPVQPTYAEFDKVPYELAIAFLEIFWCGCLPQMKEDRHMVLALLTFSDKFLFMCLIPVENMLQ